MSGSIGMKEILSLVEKYHQYFAEPVDQCFEKLARGMQGFMNESLELTPPFSSMLNELVIGCYKVKPRIDLFDADKLKDFVFEFTAYAWNEIWSVFDISLALYNRKDRDRYIDFFRDNKILHFGCPAKYAKTKVNLKDRGMTEVSLTDAMYMLWVDAYSLMRFGKRVYSATDSKPHFQIQKTFKY